MARLILKSPYLKCDGNHSVSGYLRYIGTRERVEILPDDRPPTRKQEQLVRKLVKDFPSSKKLGEYSDYETKPTKANASAFITRALEENWPQVQQSDGYMKYIATRPRAERLGDHGLFGDEDGVDLEKAMRELDYYTGNVWTHIISLKREDAARLGYDSANAWRNLLRANRNDIAAAMNIPQNHWNSQENRTPMSKTLSGKRVIGEASSFDQWREIQFIGSVAPAAVVVGLDPAEYDLANLIPLHGGAVEPVDQFLLQRCEKTLHARVVKAAMRAAHALPDGTEPGEHRPVLLAGVLAAVVGVQYQPLLITIA